MGCKTCGTKKAKTTTRKTSTYSRTAVKPAPKPQVQQTFTISGTTYKVVR